MSGLDPIEIRNAAVRALVEVVAGGPDISAQNRVDAAGLLLDCATVREPMPILAGAMAKRAMEDLVRPLQSDEIRLLVKHRKVVAVSADSLHGALTHTWNAIMPLLPAAEVDSVVIAQIRDLLRT